MKGFIDLHCHFVPGIDDGARSFDEAARMLGALHHAGFDSVCATPHMRPGLFNNDATQIRAAYERVLESLPKGAALPALQLSSEHYFDDVIFGRILAGDALPYPGGKAILLEFYESDFPFSIDQRLADIARRGMIPVVAHPERYQPIAKSPEILERLLDIGATALLDVAALIGKYGRRATKTAEELLERGLYFAACSDAHRPEDVPEVRRGMDYIVKHYGEEELSALFKDGPTAILQGRITR